MILQVRAPVPPDRRRTQWIGLLARGTASALGGLVVGLAIGVMTPTHMEVAGSEAAIQLQPGRHYDELALSGGVLTGKRATDRTALGEPLGVSVRLALDPSTFVAADGSFNADIIPAYIQAYSDPAQLAKDLQWALIKHLLLWASAGAAAGLTTYCVYLTLRRWRVRREHAFTREQLDAAQRYWRPERTLRRRVALGVVAIGAICIVPSADRHAPPRQAIRPNPIFAGTPLAGAQVGGLLRPALTAIESYVKTYFADTNKYYDELRAKLMDQLDASAVRLPEGPTIENVVFVADRHCNIGMDRVIVAVAQHFGITVLVSAGDDAFSGSFEFESACTANLAAKSQQADMTDVFVAGNHDSALTLADETKQHIGVLDGSLVTADGLTFIGIPDPRTSRYGEGIKPASAQVRRELVLAQGERAGAEACASKDPVIAVLHDPRAGQEALQNGCGKVTLALDGHTHRTAGPTAIVTSTGVGFQFVGGSTGGAPGEGAVERTFASRLTVGPLNHDASINIVSVDRDSGKLVQVTVIAFTPQQDITVAQLPAP